MFIQPGYLNKGMTGIEKERQERIKQNLRELEAAGVDFIVMKAMSLYGPKQKAYGKTTKEGKNKVGHGAGDEKFLPPEGEENLSVYSDDNESSRSQAKKAKVMGPGKKRGTSTTQILRKSQRNQEEGGSSDGATSTLLGQPLADHGQVMSVVAANDQHASVSQKEKGAYHEALQFKRCYKMVRKYVMYISLMLSWDQWEKMLLCSKLR